MAVTTLTSTRSRLGAYVALTKPRIIELLLVTTVPVMFVAERGVPPVGLVLVTVLGGSLAAGGANAINMVVDRDIDALMERTRNRPLVTGELTPRAALTFALGLEVAAFALLWWQVNLLSAVLAVSACLFYVFVYTLWLKRTSRQNIVIGGAAGAVPTLIGWTAVTGQLAWAPVVLFAVIFFWTPPHFWALAIRYREDYSAAVGPDAAVGRRRRHRGPPDRGLHGDRLGPHPAVHPGRRHGPALLGRRRRARGPCSRSRALRLRDDPTPERAMALFHWSITYVSLLFGVMAVDALLS